VGLREVECEDMKWTEMTKARTHGGGGGGGGGAM